MVAILNRDNENGINETGMKEYGSFPIRDDFFFFLYRKLERYSPGKVISELIKVKTYWPSFKRAHQIFTSSLPSVAWISAVPLLPLRMQSRQFFFLGSEMFLADADFITMQ